VAKRGVEHRQTQPFRGENRQAARNESLNRRKVVTPADRINKGKPHSWARRQKASPTLVSFHLRPKLQHERQHRVERLFAAADRLAALDLPLTDEDVAAELDAARAARRADADRR